MHAQLTRNRFAIAKFLLLEGLECYKDTYMKAYDIAKVTAELTRNLSVDEISERYVKFQLLPLSILYTLTV